MNQRTRHLVSVTLIGLMVFIFILLAIFGFVYAFLWALVCGLAIVVLAKLKNPFFVTEYTIWHDRTTKLKDAWTERRNHKKKSELFSSEFLADHVLEGEDSPFARVYPVDKEDFLIGARSTCNLVLSNGSESVVSREHCRITFRRHSRTYYIEDLRSLNGTYLGTKRLEPNSPERLLDGSEIIVGRYRFRFKLKE